MQEISAPFLHLYFLDVSVYICQNDGCWPYFLLAWQSPIPPHPRKVQPYYIGNAATVGNAVLQQSYVYLVDSPTGANDNKMAAVPQNNRTITIQGV